MMHMVVTESPHMDAVVRLFRTQAAADEYMDSEIVDAKREDDRTIQVTLSLVDDTNPDIHILDGQPGCREWYGSWDDHWTEADDLMPEPEPSDPRENDDRCHDCGGRHIGGNCGML